MVNSYKPHVIVLPEDDATRALVLGFELEVRAPRQIRAQPVARGWKHVTQRAVCRTTCQEFSLDHNTYFARKSSLTYRLLSKEKFVSEQIAKINQYPEQVTVLLVDFDDQGPARLQAMRSVIPDNLAGRVFVLGSKTNLEALKRAFQPSSLEDIGSGMAKDCRDGTDVVWSHDLLIHNKGELERLHQLVGSWLF